MKIKKRVNNPMLSQFIYDIIWASTAEQRGKLDKEYAKVFKTARSAQGFCEKSSMEDKLYLLATLGIRWFMILAKDDVTTENYWKILDMFKEEETKAAALKEISDNNIFIYSNKEMIDLYGNLSEAINHGKHRFNIDMNKAKYHVQRWSRQIQNVEYRENEETEESKKYTLDFLHMYNLRLAELQYKRDMMPLEMKILIYMHKRKNEYILREEMFGVFFGEVPKSTFTKNVRNLRDKKLIQNNAYNRAKDDKYKITGLGIDKVNTFFKKIFDSL